MAFSRGLDPYVKQGTGVQFYGYADGKARIFALPYEPPAESPDGEYPFWLPPAACWSIGIPGR